MGCRRIEATNVSTDETQRHLCRLKVLASAQPRLLCMAGYCPLKSGPCTDATK